MNRPEISADEFKNLFTGAFQMPLGWDRVATEKNVLTILSRSDPELAMQLFVNVEKPFPIDGSGFPEDVRADAAVEIFGNYWRAVGIRGLDNIRRMSRHIGSTGEYPYRAMSSVVSEVIKLRQEDGLAKVSEIVNEAIRYYRRGSQFQNRDEEFVSLLKNARHNVPDRLYLRGLRLLVGNLLARRAWKGHFIAEIGTSEGFVQFTSINSALLFQAFPLVAEANSQWANILMLRHPELRQARSKIVYVAAGVVYGDAAPLQMAQLQKEMLQQSLLDNIRRSQNARSPEVLQMTKRLVALKSVNADDLSLHVLDVDEALNPRQDRENPSVTNHRVGNGDDWQ
jgi:hypothetical protein